jgi:hypothetical protein
VIAGVPLADLTQPAIPIALGAERDVPASVQDLASPLVGGLMPAEVTSGKVAMKRPNR